MKINAVIVTHNRSELLTKCIQVVVKQTYSVNKIVVFDNNSTDGTSQLMTDFSAIKNLIYIRSSKNGGASYGFYYGIAYAKTDCDWVWVMDDDVIPEIDALEKLIEKLKYIVTDVSYLCSSVKSYEGAPMNVPSISTENHPNGYSRAFNFLSRMVIEVGSATFLSILINVDAINNVGLPYKEFFIWVDDTEYTSRLSKYFAPAYLVGDSIVTHLRVGSNRLDIGNTEDTNRIKLFRYLYRNNLVYLKHYSTRLSYIRAILSYFVKSFKYAIKLNKLDLLRAKSILLGIISFGIGDYNRHQFKDRFNNSISKKEIDSIFEIRSLENQTSGNSIQTYFSEETL